MQEAYTVATMGVTDADWKMLGYEALMQMELEVAAKAFIKVRDVHAHALARARAHTHRHMHACTHARIHV